MLSARRAALSLPVELIRLASEAGGEVGPLGLLPGVSVSRRPAVPGRERGLRAAGCGAAGAGELAGPLKVLAAVAAPDETKTANVPLDAEAEMQAVLDAVSDVAASRRRRCGSWRWPRWRRSARRWSRTRSTCCTCRRTGPPTSVELEDEDGNPVPVTAGELMQALRQAGRPVPLIVLSSCSGGSAGSQAMAAGLIGRGADRVIAMLAPVTDGYATVLARHLYQELAARPGADGRGRRWPGPGTWPRRTGRGHEQGPAAAAGVRGGHAAGRRRRRPAGRSGGRRRCR